MSATPPALPSSFVSALPSDNLGSVDTCTALDNFQDKITNHTPQGTTMVVEAGHTFGGLDFPTAARVGSGWSAIVSSMLSSLPPTGTRISQSDAVFMPTLQGTLDNGPLRIPTDSPGWRLRGIEFVCDPTQAQGFWQYARLRLGGPRDLSGAEAQPDPNIPLRAIVDRCFIHPKHSLANYDGLVQGMSVDGPDIRICESIITDIQSSGQDTKCIGTAGGRGIHLIENCFLAATAGSLFYGGSVTPAAFGWTPADDWLPKDVIIRRCDIQGLPRWNFIAPEYLATPQGMWNVKSLLEFKMMRRALIEGNRFYNNFLNPGGAPFGAIALDAWNQAMTTGWYLAGGYGPGDTEAVVEDITIRYNTFDLVLYPLQVYAGNAPTRRIHYHDNLALRVRDDHSYTTPPYSGTAVASPGSVPDLWIEHSTFLPCTRAATALAGIISPGGVQYPNLTLRNNIFGFGAGGNLHGDSNGPPGGDVAAHYGPQLDAACPGRDFQKNALVNDETKAGQTNFQSVNHVSYYDPSRWVTTDTYGAHKMNLATGVLDSDSPFKNAGTDGKDLGPDFAAMAALGEGAPPDTTLRRARGFRASSRQT